MSNTDMPAEPRRMSDAAVQAKTGRTWAGWFAILDAAGAQQMTHQQIVAYLHAEQNVGSWWQQMITVTYEQARGLRAKHQMPDGYQIAASKTIAAPAAALYQAWLDIDRRQIWLPDAPLAISKATPGKSIRATWGEQGGRLDVQFYPKGTAKTQVTIQHNKLADAEAGLRMKAYWAAALERLRAFVGAMRDE
jgi:uncharacterized protein YndB with AHSA1/START domain